MSSNNEGLLCPECMKEFPDVALLTTHFEGSHSKPTSNIVTNHDLDQSGITEMRVANHKTQSTLIEVDSKKPLSRSNESKTRPMNKLAASLGDFITNLTLKPSLNIAPSESDASSRTSFPQGSLGTDKSPTKNDDSDKKMRLKDYCSQLIEQNRVLTSILKEYYNAGENQSLNEFKQLTSKYKNLFSTLDQGKQLTKRQTEHFSRTNDQDTKLKAITSELECSKEQIENLKNAHKMQIGELKEKYDSMIAKFTENNQSNEDDVKSINSKLLLDIHNIREETLSLTKSLNETLEEKQKVDRELKEKEVYIQTLINNHTNETSKHKSKMQHLVETGVKIKNDQIILRSEVDTLKKSLTEVELSKTKLIDDNEEVMKNLLEKNEEIVSQNRKLNQKMKKLTEETKKYQDQYNNLAESNKKLGDAYTNAQKTIDELKKSNADKISSLDAIKFKLEKEIINNGATNKRVIELEEKINQLTETIEKKEVQYNELVLMSKQDITNYKKEVEIAISKLGQSESKNLEQIKRYETLKTQFEKMIIEHQQEKTKIIESEGRISELTKALSTHDDYVNGLLDKISILESQAVHLEHKYREGNLALCELDEENRKFKKKICEIYSRYWKNDDTTKKCFHCEIEFNFTNRKHHCRNCGDIFCEKCCYSSIALPCASHPEKVCDSCLEEIKHFRNQL